MGAEIHLLILSILIMLFNGSLANDCQGQTNLPRLYKNDIVLKSMISNPKRDKSQYGFLYNYPIQLLHSSNTPKINCIISIVSMEWQYCPDYLNFNFYHHQSPTAALVYATSVGIDWSNFKISILVNDQNFRSELYFGQGRFQINGGENPFRATVDVPNQTTNTKYITYITGFHALLKSQDSFYYDLEVYEEPAPNNKLDVFVQAGANTLLKKISIVYIAYNEGSDSLYFASVMEMISVPSGGKSMPISKQLVTTEHVLYGFRAIKFKSAYSRFQVGFDIKTHFTFNAITGQYIDDLFVAYFGISPRPSQICRNCPSGKIFSNGHQTTCPINCHNGYEYPLDDGTLACGQCPSQLNMEFQGDGCYCKLEYVEFEGQCVHFFQLSSLQASFSKQENECEIGFQRLNNGPCVRKCPMGIWNGFNCANCTQKGTYPVDSEGICKKCTDHCEVCQSQFTCQTCSIGFQSSGSLCQEVCGDGKKSSLQTDCDDGNSRNGDGCSANCQLEIGFSCFGGSPSSPDRCSRVNYQLTRGQYSIQHSMVLVKYQVMPALPQISQNTFNKMIQLDLGQGNRYQMGSYIDLDEDMSNFTITLNFGNVLPTEDLPITTKLKIGSGQAIQDTIQINFISNSVNYSRGQRNSIDYIH